MDIFDSITAINEGTIPNKDDTSSYDVNSYAAKEDITAYKDELPPRIVVQVKSQDSDIKETTIQSLKGAMREGDYGLFVTLSNYTKNAQKYLENAPIIRGINGTELVDLILKYYDQLSDKYRKMIPLKMVYIPIPEEE